MITIRNQIINKIKKLPENSLHEVLDFVEFLTWKERNQEASNGQMAQEDDPILSVLGTLSFDPMTNKEIDEELYGPFYSKDEGDGK